MDPTDQLPPAVVIGEEQGYKQLQAKEMAEIEDALSALDNLYGVSLILQVKIASYDKDELKAGLTAKAFNKVSEIIEKQQAVENIQRLLAYAEFLKWDEAKTSQRLEAYLKEAGLFDEAGVAVKAGPILGFNGPYANPRTAYISTVPVNNIVKAVNNLDEAAKHTWVMDAQGKIHVGSDLSLCLVGTGNLTIAACDTSAANQRWVWDKTDENRPVLKASNGSCVDHNGSNDNLSLYGCHRNWNQRWMDVQQSSAPWLSLMNAAQIKVVLDKVK